MPWFQSCALWPTRFSHDYTIFLLDQGDNLVSKLFVMQAEDSSSNFWHTHKKMDAVVPTSNPSAKKEEEGRSVDLTGQSALLNW